MALAAVKNVFAQCTPYRYYIRIRQKGRQKVRRFEERIIGLMDALEKRMLIRFTPYQTTALPKMDILPKTFLQMILVAKWLVQLSSTSPNQQRRPLPYLLCGCCFIPYRRQQQSKYHSSLIRLRRLWLPESAERYCTVSSSPACGS